MRSYVAIVGAHQENVATSFGGCLAVAAAVVVDGYLTFES